MSNAITNNVINFDFKGHNIRAIVKDGKPWFILVSICRELGISRTTDVIKRLKEDDRDKISVIDNMGREQRVWIVNEPALWDIFMRSNKPVSVEFRDWLVRDVLPSLREKGHYEMEEGKNPFQSVEDVLGVEFPNIANAPKKEEPKISSCVSENSSKPDIGWEEYTDLLKFKLFTLESGVRKKRIPFTESDKVKVLKLLKEGHSNSEIGKLLNRSNSSIVSLARKYRNEGLL